MAGKRNHIGTIRRSQVVGTYGPGAIIDFSVPGTGAPVSGLLAGLEAWDEASGKASGLAHDQTIKEPRLQRRCGVNGFRLPPVKLDTQKGSTGDVDVLPVVRFPDWLQCSRCGRLAKTSEWGNEPGDPSRLCSTCSTVEEKTFAAPVRFVVACAAGHIDEFAWQAWIGCRCGAAARLTLLTKSAGLSGKSVKCEKCKREKDFDGVFAKEALKNRGLKCRGRRPWLHDGNEGESCDKIPRVLQRGASNVYWGLIPSTIDIPPFSSGTPEGFGEHWDTLLAVNNAVVRRGMIENLGLPGRTGKSCSQLLSIIEAWEAALDDFGGDSAPLQWPEYNQFLRAEEGAVDEPNFKVTSEAVPVSLEPYFGSIILASRLRQVRAVIGFTRISPPTGDFKANDAVENLAPLSKKPLDWLPGIELLGEGIFLRLDGPRLEEWEQSPAVLKRVEAMRGRTSEDLFPDEVFPEKLTARFVLAHTFSHALMLQLSLESGYSSSALKERLYVGTDPHRMCGLLIHTGSPDSEGTLGGLVRQGKAERLERSVLQAIESMAWCSSDPVCITGAMVISSPRNGAACHACTLLPETSCEEFNRYLDRAFLVGTPDNPDLGFFSPLVGGSS